jgi:FKBP-type peptidyl-prolyl cis-trans isomerase
MNKKSFTALMVLFIAVMTSSAFSQNFPGFSKTKTGLYYKIYKTGTDTVTPRIGNYVEFDMIYHGKSHGKDSVFFNSKSGDHVAPVKFFLPAPGFKGDLNEGIAMLAKGDSGVFIVNADSLIYKTFKMKQRPSGIDSNEYFYFHIHMLSFQTPESMIFNEEMQIKNYVKDSNITVKPNSMGMYIIETKAGTGTKIDSGCHVKMNYKISLLDGKEIYSSYDRPQPIKFEYGKPIDTRGFGYGLSTLREGSRARFLVPSSLAYGYRGSGGVIAPYQPIIYDVEILEVKTKAEYEKQQADDQKAEQMMLDSLKKDEPIQREKYLQDNHITVKPLPSGLYYIPVLTGTGPKAESGKTVKVHYTGKLLNGRIFDSSRKRPNPLEFMLGRGQVIKGWEEGISMMRQGGKATLIIPSTIGYSDRDMGVIPPYSTLVFDVELIEVK